MDNLKNNPALSLIHPMLTNTLAVQREVATFTESQMKLAQAHTNSSIETFRAAFVASHNATQAMAKVWTDAMAPATPTA